jgi:hypothetical protein
MRLFLAGVVASLIAFSVQADAQTTRSSASPQVERVARNALAYEDSLWMRFENAVIWNTDRAFNAPPDQISASIEASRNALSAERARLLALPPPNLRDRDIDLTFIANVLLERRLRRIDSSEAAIDAASAMLAAQRAEDCSTMQARAAELDRLREETRVIGLNDGQRLHEALAAFGGLPHPPIPVAIDPPPSPEARGLEKLKEAISRALRCPLPEPDTSIELTARVQADGRIEATVLGVSDESLRDALNQRLASARFQPTYLLRNSPIVNRSVRMRFANQRLELAP